MAWIHVILLDVVICTAVIFLLVVPAVPRKITYRKAIEYRYFNVLSTFIGAFITLGIVLITVYRIYDLTAQVSIFTALVVFFLSAFFLPFVFTLVHSAFIAAFMTVHKPVHRKTASDFTKLTQDQYPTVDIILASRNEPFAICKMTFDCAVALDYPADKLSIVVVDNSVQSNEDFGHWKNYVDSFSQNPKGPAVKFIHREGVEGFKPRNLDIGLAASSGEFVLFLDVDSTLAIHALCHLLSEIYRDTEMAFVQSYLISTNKSSTGRLARTAAWGLMVSRYRECLRGAHGGWPLFVGHNALWRRKVLQEIGTCEEYHRGEVVVAEDASLTLRAYDHGYYGNCMWHPTGEWVPGSLDDLENMWARWSYGTCQVVVKYWHLIFGFASNKLTLMERVDALQHTMGYFVLGSIPIWMLLSFVLPGRSYSPVMSILVVIPWSLHFLAFLKNEDFRKQFGPHPKVGEFLVGLFVLEPFLAWVKFRSILRYIRKGSQGWRPTGKKGLEPNSWKAVFVQRMDMILFASGILIWFIVDVFQGFSIEVVLLRLPSLVIALGMLATVLVYGRATLTDPENPPQTASIAAMKQLMPELDLYSTL